MSKHSESWGEKTAIKGIEIWESALELQRSSALYWFSHPSPEYCYGTPVENWANSA